MSCGAVDLIQPLAARNNKRCCRTETRVELTVSDSTPPVAPVPTTSSLYDILGDVDNYKHVDFIVLYIPDFHHF